MHTQDEIVESSKLELAEEYKKLLKNKSFQKVILNGFLNDGSVYLTKNLMKVKAQYESDIIQEMRARSTLWKFLDTIEADAKDILTAREMGE